MCWYTDYWYSICAPYGCYRELKAVGATLGELDEKGVEQPLVFASHKLTETQMAWATIEREAYAIIWALNRFRDIILYYLRVTCVHFL